MSDTILSGDFTVYYTNDTGGDKQIRWTGSATGTRSVNELYGALQDLFDNVSGGAGEHMEEGIPMAALTPTQYTLGLIEVNDPEPWYIDPITVQHLTGGSLTTVGWTGNILAISYNATGAGTAFSSGDVGRTITGGTTGDTGTILHYDERYGTELGVVWIRPVDSGDDFDNASETYTVGGSSASGSFTATLDAGGSLSGNSLYTNIYSIGSLQSETTLYVVQNNLTLTGWWPSGHIDILVQVQELGSLIDFGILTVFARKYSSLYENFTTDASGGGRIPIPITTADDLNNNTGYRQMILAVTNDAFAEGDVIQDDSDSTIRGVVTNYDSGTNTLQYYLTGSLTDFSAATGTFASISPGTGTGTAVNSTAIGPAASPASTITVTFGGTTADIDNDSIAEPYSVTIDCQQIALSTVHERLKYLTRRGATGDIDDGSQTVVGEHYEAIGDLYIPYDTGSIDNPFTEGETITGPNNFTGTLTSKHDRGASEGFIIVRNTSGTIPADNDQLTGVSSGHTANVDEDGGSDPIETITQTNDAPFGTFAGGTFFGARGVLLTDVPAADANNLILIDSEGNQRTPPLTVPLTITNTVAGDRVSVFLSTGTGSTTVNKNQFTSHATNNSVGLNTFEITTTIPPDTPATGTLRVPIRDDTTHKITGETRYTYTGWSGSTFTGVSPSLVTTYNFNDTAYVPYIDEEATGTSVSESISYFADRDVVIRVRITGMRPFQVDGIINSSGLSVNVIRTTDDIYQ
jgi:hypothetical protein